MLKDAPFRTASNRGCFIPKQLLPPSHHWPGVQAARVSLGHRGSLLTVHYVSEVEQVRRGLAEQGARGRGLRTWGALLHRLRLLDFGAGGSREGMGSALTLGLVVRGALSLLPAGRPRPLLGSGAGSCETSCEAAGASTVDSSIVSEFCGIVASTSVIFNLSRDFFNQLSR